MPRRVLKSLLHRYSKGGVLMDRQKMIDNLIGQSVKVNVYGTVLIGIIQGRLSPWACVHLPGQVASIVYSWDTVNNAVKNGDTLLV